MDNHSEPITVKPNVQFSSLNVFCHQKEKGSGERWILFQKHSRVPTNMIEICTQNHENYYTVQYWRSWHSEKSDTFPMTMGPLNGQVHRKILRHPSAPEVILCVPQWDLTLVGKWPSDSTARCQMVQVSLILICLHVLTEELPQENIIGRVTEARLVLLNFHSWRTHSLRLLHSTKS